MVGLVAENVRGEVVDNCGHLIPEERPEEIIRRGLTMVDAKAAHRRHEVFV
jgi:pimeloyl-ACP methyl ester carboxylesterase